MWKRLLALDLEGKKSRVELIEIRQHAEHMQNKVGKSLKKARVLPVRVGIFNLDPSVCGPSGMSHDDEISENFVRVIEGTLL